MSILRSLFPILSMALMAAMAPQTTVAQSSTQGGSYARISCDGIELHHLYSDRITLNLYDRAPADYTHLLAAGDHIVFVDVVPVAQRQQRNAYFEGEDSALRPDNWFVGTLFVIDRTTGEKVVFQLDAPSRDAPFYKAIRHKEDHTARCTVSGHATAQGEAGPQDVQFVAQVGVPTEYHTSGDLTYPIMGEGTVTTYARSIDLGAGYDPIYFALVVFYEPQEGANLSSGSLLVPQPLAKSDFAICVVRLGVFESCLVDMGAGPVEVSWDTQAVTVRSERATWRSLP